MAHIQVMDGTMLAIHHLGPVGDHLRTVGVGGEAQGEIDVRPPVLATERGGPGQRSAADATIGPGYRDELIPQPFAILGGEHGHGDYGRQSDP